MTIARAQLIDPSVSRWYHCVSRCVRRAPLLAAGSHDRKAWLERRIEELAGIFAVSVGAYSVLDNQVQLLLRHDAGVTKNWSASEVVRRRARLFPPYDKSRRPLPVTDVWVENRRKDATAVLAAREQLQSIGWFMKCLKEPLSRMANREDQTGGTFFEQRFKSVGILDEQSLLAACIYIDLGPARAARARGATNSLHVDQNQIRTLEETRSSSQGPLGRTAEEEDRRPVLRRGGRLALALPHRRSIACPSISRRHIQGAFATRLSPPG